MHRYQILIDYTYLADTGNYPGREEITTGLRHVSILLSDKDSYTFINRLEELKDDLLGFAEDFHDIDNFYKTQRPVWEKLRSEYTRFDLNRFELDKDTDAASALKRMEEILNAPSPYGIIQQAEMLIKKVSTINDNLIVAHKSNALKIVEALLDDLDKELQKVKADEGFRSSALKPLVDTKSSLENMGSIAHLQQVEQRANELFQQQIAALSDYQKKKEPTGKPEEKVKPVVTIQSRTCSSKVYLETKDDVNEFVNTLKEKINSAIDKNQRVKID